MAGPLQPAGPAPGSAFVGRGARPVASIVDWIVSVPLILFLVQVPFHTVDGHTTYLGRPETGGDLATVILPSMGAMLLALAYFGVGWARGGQTLGMKMLGIRVVRDRDGGRVGWGAAIVRLIGYDISAVMGLGFIWIFIDGRRRGWHDIMAGTVVIADRR